jgi:hypothetical protein
MEKGEGKYVHLLLSRTLPGHVYLPTSCNMI